MILLISLVFSALLAPVSAECSRDMLQNATDQYTLAQSSGSISSLKYLANSVNYTENEQAINITAGVLSQAMKIDHKRSIHDTAKCATFTELIVANSDHPYVIGTRMLLANDQITTIESIVTDKGDWAFNATGYLYWNSLESWEPIPEDKRDSREVIKAAGDAYFNRFNNVSFVVPFGTHCARLEGGAYTGRGNLSANTCDIGGLPSTIVVTNRRYVVDEIMGVVDIFLGFPGLDRTRGQEPMPDSHMFRVENGKIRYIHTVSSCVNAGCGMNGTIPMQKRQSPA